MTLTARELQSHLWEAANILRGSAVDRTDWKGYILPLLFFKRICDVWDEETSEAVDIYGDVDTSQFPEVHRFQVPEGCHWRDIRETAANVGTTLPHAMQQIELANLDKLYRVFGAADWANREKFTDELLKDLFEGFSLISLGNTVVDTDILGDAYEYLVGKFADVTRRNRDVAQIGGGAHSAGRDVAGAAQVSGAGLSRLGFHDRHPGRDCRRFSRAAGVPACGRRGLIRLPLLCVRGFRIIENYPQS